LCSHLPHGFAGWVPILGIYLQHFSSSQTTCLSTGS
jgi:hypothetical protein